MQKNGWNLFQFKPFAQRLQTLTQDVTRLAQADPVGYKQHPKRSAFQTLLKRQREQAKRFNPSIWLGRGYSLYGS